MSSWLDRPGSLNWANKKRLAEQISKFEATISSTEESLLFLLAHVGDWKNHARNLADLRTQQRLTANHILQLRPLLDQTEAFQKALEVLFAETPLFHNEENKIVPR